MENILFFTQLFEEYKIKNENICNNLKYYIDYFDYLTKIFQIDKEKGKELLLSKEKLIMEELVDYHGQYRHAMKELFYFDRIWSNQNLFFKDKLADIKKSNLKYKHTNYYTNNYQNPVIYPDLDYKNKYPEFSRYKYKNTKDNNDNIDTHLFKEIKEKENEKNKGKDDYCFDFVSTELDNIIKKNDNLFFARQKFNHSLYFFKACLIKKEYHVKGVLFIVNQKEVYFYSHLFKDQNNKKYVCKFKEKDEGICEGSILPCIKKEENRKIKFNFSDSRMIMKRIIYYRRTGIEFFTQTKSYLFNIRENNSGDSKLNFDTVSSIIDQIMNDYKDSYFTLQLDKKDIIGYIKKDTNIMGKKEMRDYENILQKDNIDPKKEKTTVGLFYQIISEKKSMFDLIMLINLISNRSFNDVNQYPVFPALYFYERYTKLKKNRELKLPIGFQMSTKELEKRTLDIKAKYKDSLEIEGEHAYFGSNYSNQIYVTGFLMRLFPYSFMSIELQGENFDQPDRLFFSVEETLIQIFSSNNNDIRELIPEFFYLPEMFMNINNIDFGKTSNEIHIDDCIMPYYGNSETIEKYCLFIYEMIKNLDEAKNRRLWIQNIFGINQRYENYKDKKGQYFYSRCFIDNISEDFSKNLNESTIAFYQFGMVPLKTIYNENILQKKKTEKTDKEFIEDYFKKKKFNNFNKEKDIDLIKNLIGKASDEIDFDDIKNCCYNERLNMFAICSFDGVISVYILPNKLISMIKDPNGSYFDNVFLCSNPFPCVIGVKENSYLVSYSLSGMVIKFYPFNKYYKFIVAIIK